MRVFPSAVLAACLAAPLGAGALEVTPVPSDLALVSLLGGPGEAAVGFRIEVAEIAWVPQPSTALLLLAVGGALCRARRQRSPA
jgi:hypothetical protein